MKNLFVAFLVLFGMAAWDAALAETPNYRGMVERIDQALQQADAEYRRGDIEAAKKNVQRSYFEIFENLEGPIRINISAKRSYQLEAEFGKIRKLMIEGESADIISARIAAQVKALDELLPRLEKGVVIRAEGVHGEPAIEAGFAGDDETTEDASAIPGMILPYWLQVVSGIRADLLAAAAALEASDKEQAKSLISRAYFDRYKNTLLETAVRRGVSQKQDIAFNAEFVRIQRLVEREDAARLIRNSADALDEDLQAVLPGLPLIGGAIQAASKIEEPAVDWSAVIAKVDAEIRRALDLAGTGAKSDAVEIIQNSYFDIFEASGMEARVGARDSSFKTTLEAYFSKLIAQINADAPEEDRQAVADAMKADMQRAADMLGGVSSDPWALFGYALLIILREGFEAMLIVTALLAYLVKTGNADKQKVIVNSVLVALGMSVVTAILLKLVFEASAASQEALEGGAMMVAAVVLFTMSYWLISKSEADKWNAYIQGKVDNSISTGSMRTLWFASFLAVYREGAETVLFFQALTADARDAAGIGALIAGFLVGCALLGVLYFIMRAGALRLPIRPFFQFTSALLYLMAFVFIGKGVMEFVEGKIIQPTLVSWAPEFTPLGIYPYVESLAPQALLIVAAIISLIVLIRKPAAAKSSAGS